MNEHDKKRAVEMLLLAAKYIEDNCPGESTYYDEAKCDGYCLADDCRIAAERLRDNAEPTIKESLTVERGMTDWRYFANYIDGCIRVSDETCKCQRFVNGSWRAIMYEQARLYASSVRFSEVDPKRGWAKIDAAEDREAQP